MAPTITKKNGLNVYSNVPIIPNVPVYNADGSFYQLERLLVPNPLAVLAQNVNTHSGGSFNGNVRIEYAPFTSLRLSSSFGIDGLTNKQNVFNSSKNATGQNAGGLAQIYDRTNFSWISFSQATYTPTLRNGHKADVTMGFEAQSQSTKLLRGSGSGFTYYRLNELSNAQNQTAASSRQNSNSYSVYGQSSYSYKNKYFTTVSGRYDAASIFGPDVNNTVNASIGLGWSINKEKFLSDSRWIDLLRLRGSYGTTGNSRIGSYEAKGLYNFSDAGYNGIVSSSPATAPNPDLTWEKSYKLNVGLDFNFRKRFSFSLDVYQNIVDDAISIIRIPVENGFNEMLDNVAKMRNRGVDGSLQAQVLSGKLSWTSTINFGLNKNVILEVKGKRELFSGSANAAVLKTGISTSAIWGFRFAGIDSQTGNELYYDRDGKVTPASLLNRNMSMAYQLGDRLPTVQGGFINNFSYRGVTLTVNILYSLGAERLIENSIENNGRNLDNSNQSVNLLDRWQRPGDVTHIPRLSRTHPPVPNSTRYLYEDSYLKLSNISVAYALPKAITDRLKGIRLTIFGNGTNLWYWYTSPSPEGRNGIKEYKFGFPEAQSFTGGFRMGI
jgi:outer membrane receptor protein involved in Fe transport